MKYAPYVRLDRQWTEADLLRHVRAMASACGWLTYHTHDSRRSEPGFPDLVLCHPKVGKVLFIELKSNTGRDRPEQVSWRWALKAAGQDYRTWRPSDLPEITATLGVQS